MCHQTLRIQSTVCFFVFLLLITSSNILRAQVVAGIKVNGNTVAQGDTVYVCQGNSLTYTSSATGNTTINWQFYRQGVPTNSSVANPPAILYSVAGIDSTVQTVSDGTTIVSMVIFIKVSNVHPVADFTFTDNVCSATSVQFNSTVTGTAPYSYAWTFGGGGTSNVANPVNTFTALGCGTATLNNTLTVTDATGCSTSIITHSINILKAPDIGLQDQDPFSPFSNCENSPTPTNPNFVLVLNNISASAACITSYTISWGDGTPNSTFPPSTFPVTHTYTQLGAFNLVFTAIGSNGCSSSKSYTVANQTNPAGSLGTLGTTTNLCAPATVPFTIANWQINSIGTQYFLNFGDGTSILLTHPLNPGNTTDTIYHTYTTSSCPAGTFNATLNVTNACGTTPYTAGGIRVLKKAASAFTINASSYCIGQSVCFNNTTTPGAGINCSTAANTTWDFGDGSPPVTGTLSPCHTYTLPGIYTVTLTTSTYCGPSTFSLPVCITTPPVPGFTLDNITGCAPVSATATNTTVSLNNCTTAPYLWTVTYTAGFCGATSSWAFTNGTNATSTNPSFVFNNPGTYRITLTVNNPCGNFTIFRDVTVKKPPVVTLPSIANSCGPVTITPTGTVTACGTGTLTYSWIFAGGTPATSSNANPGPVVFSNAGLHTISLSVTNECGTVTANQQFTIDTITTADAGPAQNLCGNTITMAGNTAVIGTGVWTRVSGPNTPTITVPSSPATTITGLIPGTYVFKWTITNGSCVSFSNVTITIASGPTTAAAGPDQNLCLAASATLAGNTPLVGTGVWTLISSGTNPPPTITNATLPNTTVTGLLPGVYIFRWTTNFSTCTPSTDDVQITVYDNPSVSDAGTDQTICSSTVTMTGNTPAIGTGTWTMVSGPNTASITTPSSPVTTITGLIPGTYIFKWKISNGVCPPNEDIVQVIVSAVATTAAAGPDQTVCATTSITLAGNTATVGTGVWTTISGPNTPVITTVSSPTTTVTGLVPGTYIFQWTITNGVCPPTNDQVQITINDNVTVADAGPPQNLCGTSITMAGNTAVIGTGVWSFVSGPAGSVITTPSSPTTTITGLIPGTYIFKWTITNGSCVSFSNVTIIIASGPTTATAGPDQNLCLATTATLAGNTPLVGTGVWTLISSGTNPPPTITTTTLPNTTVTGLLPGVYIFRWTTSFSTCTPSTDDVQVTIYDNPTVADAGTDQTICSSTVTMTGNTPAVGTGTWTMVSGPNTPSITTPSSSSTTITGLIPGTYIFKWKTSNGVCPTSEDLVQIIVTAVATTSAAGPDQTLCAATSTTLAGNTAIVGTGVWTYVSGPAGSAITTPSSPATTITGLVPGTYIFQWTITNGVCPPSIDQVQINNLNDLQNLINAPVTTICSGQSVTINGTPPTGGTGTYIYQWQQSTDGITWTGIVGATSPNYTTTLTASTYFRRNVTSLPCQKYSTAIFITVQSAVTSNIISANQSICINTAASTITGSVPTGGNGVYTYVWQQSTDGGITWVAATGANTNSNYTPPGVLTQTTLYRRIVSTSLCSGPQANNSNVVTITINQDSKALFTANPAIHCAPFILGTAITVTPYPDRNGLYQWFANGVSIGNNTTGVFPGYTIINPGTTVTIKLVTTSQFGCKSDSMQLQFSTVTTAFANFTRTPAAGCGPLTVAFTNTTTILNNSIQYFWIFGNGTFSNAMNPAPVTYLNNPNFTDTIYHITLKAYNGCDTTYHFDSVKVFPNSKARFAVDTARGCSPFTIHILNTSPGNNFAYYWNFGDGVTDTTYSTGPLTHTYNTGTITTYTIRLISQNQCSRDTQTINIVVSPNIIQAFITANGNQLSGCAPHTVIFNNSSVGAAQVVWDFGDNTPIITTPNNQSTVIHLYTNAGVYTANIHLRNDCSDTLIHRTITVYAPPVANFTIVNPIVCPGTTVSFTNTSQNADSYQWLFGDGGTSSSQNVQHSYTNAGIYQVTLVALKVHPSGFVCTDTLRKTVDVKSKIPAIISIINNQPCVPYVYTATALNAATASLVEWFITNTAIPQSLNYYTGANIVHTFAIAGVYQVKLVVHTADACADSVIQTVTVYNVPTVTFSPFNTITCNHDTTLLFTTNPVNPANDPLVYKWFINGVQQAVGNPYSNRFVVPATVSSVTTFTVQCLAQNIVGCGDSSLIGKVIVNPLPLPHILVSPSYVLQQPDYTFTFKDTAAADPNKFYTWNMGDRTLRILNGQQITYQYGDTGTYKIKLQVINYQTTCSAYDSVTVRILYVPGYLQVPNAMCMGCSNNALKRFLPLGKGLKEYHLTIYNTWGQKLFETTKLNANGSPEEAWDGTVNGQLLQQDAYTWKIEARYINNTEWKGMIYPGSSKPVKAGFITIIK